MNKILKMLEDAVAATKQKKKKEEEEATKEAIQKEAEKIDEWMASNTDEMYDFKKIYISLSMPHSSVEKRTLVMYGNPIGQRYRNEVQIGESYESNEDKDIVIAAIKYIIKNYKGNNCITIKEKRTKEIFAASLEINWKD